MRIFVVFVSLLVPALVFGPEPTTTAEPGVAALQRSHVFVGPTGRIEASLSGEGERLALAVTMHPSVGSGELRTGARLAEGQRFAMRLSSIPGLAGFDVFQAVREGDGVVVRVSHGEATDEVRLGLEL